MSAAEVDKEVREAFKLWSEVTDLSFTNRGYGPVHIEIRFETRSGLALISNLEDLWFYFFNNLQICRILNRRDAFRT